MWMTAVLAVTIPFCQAKPPKGAVWKTSVAEGKAEARKRGVPMIVFVAAEDGSQSLCDTLADAGVVRMLKHFSCVYLSKGYNRSEFQSNYAPWVAKTTADSHRPPLLVFGTPGGEVAADHRSEGRSPGADDLVKHLDQALKALAPAEHSKAKGETLSKATLAEHGDFLEDAADRIEDSLAPDTVAALSEELAWALRVVKSAEGKLASVKDKPTREAAAARLKDVKARLGELAKYKGKDDAKFEKPLEALGEAVEELRKILNP